MPMHHIALWLARQPQVSCLTRKQSFAFCPVGGPSTFPLMPCQTRLAVWPCVPPPSKQKFTPLLRVASNPPHVALMVRGSISCPRNAGERRTHVSFAWCEHIVPCLIVRSLLRHGLLISSLLNSIPALALSSHPCSFMTFDAGRRTIFKPLTPLCGKMPCGEMF